MRRTRTARGPALALTLVLLVGAVLMMGTSSSAFTTQSANPTSTWAAGSVTLGDDDSGQALFTTGVPGTGQVSAAALKPGQSRVNCVKVDYTGTAPAAVRLFVTTRSGTNGTGGTGILPTTHISVEEGTAGAFGCAGFAGATTTWDSATHPNGATVCSGAGCFSDVINSFPSTYATGLPSALATWTNGTSRVYRITMRLDIATPETAEGATASVGFTWEAQSA
ncbi:hypothetical protein Sya03_56500 [Spirilliplanes yamanashiensis]|uniref:Uncharacterized protein n=1 Tax=Spirilliplanes yamanashiensis TaxID=42233 RepID=A0A8J4DMC8_9ACTN|nr:hypothetical protein Sya03_56500 [Spirilliplanes yamanashiensis]